MSKANVRRQLVLLEKNKVPKEKSTTTLSPNFSYKHLKRIYPIGLHKSSSSSSLSLSSLSLSLSENSIDSSSINDSTSPLDQKISLALRLIAPPPQRRESPAAKVFQQQSQSSQDTDNGELRRCNWITKNSGKFYIQVL